MFKVGDIIIRIDRSGDWTGKILSVGRKFYEIYWSDLLGERRARMDIIDEQYEHARIKATALSRVMYPDRKENKGWLYYG